MKIGIILRCCNVKTLSGHMITGVLLWSCCMIVDEYMLCWCMMTSEDGSKSLKMDFNRLMG